MPPDYKPGTTRTVSEAYYMSAAEDQARFKQALTEAGVPFTLEMLDGKEHVRWEGADAAKANEVREKLFGPDLPSGRNVAFETEIQSKFKTWLTEKWNSV